MPKKDPDLATTGGRIRSARLKKKLTQIKLAELTGNTQSQISAWETNALTPERENLKGLSKTLGPSIDWFVSGQEQIRKNRDKPSGENPEEVDAPQSPADGAGGRDQARLLQFQSAYEYLVEQADEIVSGFALALTTADEIARGIQPRPTKKAETKSSRYGRSTDPKSSSKTRKGA